MALEALKILLIMVTRTLWTIQGGKNLKLTGRVIFGSRWTCTGTLLTFRFECLLNGSVIMSATCCYTGDQNYDENECHRNGNEYFIFGRLSFHWFPQKGGWRVSGRHFLLLLESWSEEYYCCTNGGCLLLFICGWTEYDQDEPNVRVLRKSSWKLRTREVGVISWVKMHVLM